MRRLFLLTALVLLFASFLSMEKERVAADPPAQTRDRLSQVFSSGWMPTDSNGNGIPDTIRGKIVVPDDPSAGENAAAANLAARLGYGTTGLTLPLVVKAADFHAEGPAIWIGKSAVPETARRLLAPLASLLQKNEGGIFVAGDGLAVLGNDEAGLLAAADAFSSRAPYVWTVPGDSLSAIPEGIENAAPQANVELVGVTYEQGKIGIRRAILRSASKITEAQLDRALASPRLALVHELIVWGGEAPRIAVHRKPQTPAPAAPGKTKEKSGEQKKASAAEEGEGYLRLDLATLYTSKGLFKGSPKMPIPSSLNAHLYVPSGAAGTAMANLAARMGLETTGITLPLASPAASAEPSQVKTPVVISANSPFAEAAEKKLSADEAAMGQSFPHLSPGEGEVRVVDKSFAKDPAVLILGDDSGEAAVLDLLSAHFPDLWQPGKQYRSLENIRYDLHRFFSLHSAAGQASAALYHLDRWAEEIARSAHGSAGMGQVKAEIYVDLADPGLAAFAERMLKEDLHVAAVEVTTGSLHAGTQCCQTDPALHYQSRTHAFHQGTPTFRENLVIPWEGKRLLTEVQRAAANLNPSQPVTLVARVSEGPEERRKLTVDLEGILARAGLDRARMQVEVLCAYKQGYSWLMDEIAPRLAGKPVARIQIDFAKDIDPTEIRAMHSPARWVQELYPVDEMLAKKLGLALDKITLDEFVPRTGDPTYRVHAYDASGHEILSRSFRVTTAMRPYNGVMPEYEQVRVETGWVRMQNGGNLLLNKRIETDTEEFWDHYQSVTLPKIDHFIMAQAQGDIRPEYQPLFDTLRLDMRMSEPDYNIGLDKERISSLEALQEDTLYSTNNFFEMMGDLEAGHALDYPGRIIPIVHPSVDGEDGHVRIEFYGKPAAHPLVRLSWRDASGKLLERERNLPALEEPLRPRLIAARVKAGAHGVEELTWSLPADYLHDDYPSWIRVELRDRVEHTVFSVEQAEGQLHWLGEMHAAGLYGDDIAASHLGKMKFEFRLPRPLDASVDSPAPGAATTWAVSPPQTPRPLISAVAPIPGTPIVQWREPISPADNAAILARLARYPGVHVYWMGRSYLGENIWAADLMLPSPSTLRSWAKETTLKAAVIYSGRQHANEVSSTSHIDRLGELLVTDRKVRALLKQVNVVLHPIDNPDGAQLSVELAKITPDNLLHPGYHGSLSADVVEGQRETDPIYPESRTRPLLIEAWLPDAFLNPHGYPSHEWVQPFSDYTAWVMSREGAGPGREWWIPRGWFTSLNYLRDPEHPYSEPVTYALRDRIVAAERAVPGLLPLEERMNARYARFGQRWDPRYMVQPIVDGIRIYMSLAGLPAKSPAITSGILSPDITWDSGYTEAPDETAHGEYMKLVASAGLAFDLVHLKYLAQGKLRITRTEKSGPDGVTWKLARARPILPSSEPPLPPLPETDRR